MQAVLAQDCPIFCPSGIFLADHSLPLPRHNVCGGRRGIGMFISMALTN